MTAFLDDERLNGPHTARISARPQRAAIPIEATGPKSLSDVIELECQLWGGAANIILPVEGRHGVPAYYRKTLPGSQIDYVLGSGHGVDLISDAGIDPSVTRDVSRDQLALGLLPYRGHKGAAPLEVVMLDPADPWFGIYLACLGRLPEQINPEIIRHGNWLPELDFDDFIEIRRVEATGSMSDLLSRTFPTEPRVTPRQTSMVKLAHGGTASSNIRSGRQVLPDPGYGRLDAGPNVLVVCSPGSLDDLALLWNLRAAHGDFYAAPLGVPIGELTDALVRRLASVPGLARNGFSDMTLCLTSASVSVEEISSMVGKVEGVAIRTPAEMIMYGSVLGLSRDEVLIWEEGRASFVPLEPSDRRSILDQRNINDLLIMQFDVTVEAAPLPISDGFRVDAFNGRFHGGALNRWSSPKGGERISRVEWPSRGLIAKSLASISGFEPRESAPGVAARILLEGLGGFGSAYMFCHAPLLELLESMSARLGFNWYKDRLRRVGLEANPADAVGGSIDELPEKSFHDFKRVFGGREAAAKYWLEWAERSRVIIKGFPLQCPGCGAKQWIPVNSFNPPIACRGCAKGIEYPFGNRPAVDFKYRLSEQVRRVYEVDAIGHVLVARFFESVLGSGPQGRLIGMHPGMSVYVDGESKEIGEADLLMLSRQGEFIPIEVKRTMTGLTSGELDKLEALRSVLGSPWSGVAACQYSRDSAVPPEELVQVGADGSYLRMVLTYDRLLDPRSVWTLGGDPFSAVTLNEEEIAEREKSFVNYLVSRSEDSGGDWLAYSMLRKRGGEG